MGGTIINTARDNRIWWSRKSFRKEESANVKKQTFRENEMAFG